MIELLKKSGLNEYEAKAYSGLLNKGTCSAYGLAKSEGIPTSKIYLILEKLLKKGIIKVIPSNPKQYSALNPKTALKNYLNEKIEELQREKDEVESYFENYSIKSDDSISIMRSSDNRMNLFEEGLMKCKKYYYSYINDLPATSHPIIKLIRKKKSEGVDIKSIVSPSKINIEKFKEWKKMFPNIYKLNTEEINIKIAVNDDDDCHFSLSNQKNYSIIRVKDKDFAKMIKSSFLIIWSSIK